MQAWLRGALTPDRVLYDLFGGSGNFSLPLARQMTEVHCVDVGAPATRPAETPKNLTYHRAALVPWLLRQASTASISRRASAILDPPREGLADDFADIESGLRRLGVNQVVAIGLRRERVGSRPRSLPSQRLALGPSGRVRSLSTDAAC